MSAQVLLACGCVYTFREENPRLCPTHGPQKVVRVVGLGPPRIRGVASGPHVSSEDLAPFVGRISGQES